MTTSVVPKIFVVITDLKENLQYSCPRYCGVYTSSSELSVSSEIMPLISQSLDEEALP